MEISPDQLIQLIETIRRERGQERRMQMHPPSEEQFIADILRDEYGVDRVRQPQAYEVVVREYLPVEWHPRPGAPTVDSVSGAVVTRPPYQSQILADLDTLRRSPLAALFYIIGRAAGQDSASAMNLARFAQAVGALVMVARPLVHSRTISPNTGLPQNARHPRVAPAVPQPRGAAWAQQQLYQRDLQQRGYGAPPGAGGTTRPQPVPHLRR